MPGLLPVAWAAETATAADVELWGELFQVVGFLVALVALAVVVSRFGKRLTPAWFVVHDPVRLLGGRTLAPGVGVRLLQVGERVFLLGVSRERVTLLAELRPEEVPPPPVATTVMTGKEEP